MSMPGCVLCLCLGVFYVYALSVIIYHSVMGPCCYLCLYMSEKNFPPPTTPLIIWRDGGGNNFFYYIVPCRPNVVNTAERTVTRNCITFATISFLFISVVCVVFYGLFFSLPYGRPGLHQLFPCARLVTAWCQQSPYSRPAP